MRILPSKSINKKDVYSYLIQGLIILFSILLSLSLENLNDRNRDIEKKNSYLIDLSNTLKEDVTQIQSLRSILNESVKTINLLQNDIESNNQTLSDEQIISLIITVEVGFSFFPQDGVFNQMISTGYFELIENERLKENLLEMYNHQMARNYATSLEIDNFNIEFRRSPYEKFRIRFNYNLTDGEFYGARELVNYTFNKSYYLSDEFYGLLSQVKLYSNMYQRQLFDIEKKYLETLELLNTTIS